VKQKILLISVLIFFIIINTQYYWEAKLGLYSIPFLLILLLAYLSFIILLLRQIFLAINEKLVNNYRNGVIVVIILVLVITFFKPRGIIDFDKLNGDYVLIATREGAANCMTTLKLNKEMEFRELINCFGTSEIKGKYEIKNDTIFFKNVELGRHEKEFYEFAIIKPCKYCGNKKFFNLVRFKNKNDTVGHDLSIIENNLIDNLK
jgi:hypothetical protein